MTKITIIHYPNNQFMIWNPYHAEILRTVFSISTSGSGNSITISQVVPPNGFTYQSNHSTKNNPNHNNQNNQTDPKPKQPSQAQQHQGPVMPSFENTAEEQIYDIYARIGAPPYSIPSFQIFGLLMLSHQRQKLAQSSPQTTQSSPQLVQSTQNAQDILDIEIIDGLTTKVLLTSKIFNKMAPKLVAALLNPSLFSSIINDTIDVNIKERENGIGLNVDTNSNTSLNINTNDNIDSTTDNTSFTTTPAKSTLGALIAYNNKLKQQRKGLTTSQTASHPHGKNTTSLSPTTQPVPQTLTTSPNDKTHLISQQKQPLTPHQRQQISQQTLMSSILSLFLLSPLARLHHDLTIRGLYVTEGFHYNMSLIAYDPVTFHRSYNQAPPASLTGGNSLSTNTSTTTWLERDGSSGMWRCCPGGGVFRGVIGGFSEGKYKEEKFRLTQERLNKAKSVWLQQDAERKLKMEAGRMRKYGNVHGRKGAMEKNGENGDVPATTSIATPSTLITPTSQTISTASTIPPIATTTANNKMSHNVQHDGGDNGDDEGDLGHGKHPKKGSDGQNDENNDDDQDEDDEDINLDPLLHVHSRWLVQMLVWNDGKEGFTLPYPMLKDIEEGNTDHNNTISSSSSHNKNTHSNNSLKCDKNNKENTQNLQNSPYKIPIQHNDGFFMVPPSQQREQALLSNTNTFHNLNNNNNNNNNNNDTSPNISSPSPFITQWRQRNRTVNNSLQMGLAQDIAVIDAIEEQRHYQRQLAHLTVLENEHPSISVARDYDVIKERYSQKGEEGVLEEQALLSQPQSQQQPPLTPVITPSNLTPRTTGYTYSQSTSGPPQLSLSIEELNGAVRMSDTLHKKVVIVAQTPAILTQIQEAHLMVLMDAKGFEGNDTNDDNMMAEKTFSTISTNLTATATQNTMSFNKTISYEEYNNLFKKWLYEIVTRDDALRTNVISGHSMNDSVNSANPDAESNKNKPTTHSSIMTQDTSTPPLPDAHFSYFTLEFDSSMSVVGFYKRSPVGGEEYHSPSALLYPNSRPQLLNIEESMFYKDVL